MSSKTVLSGKKKQKSQTIMSNKTEQSLNILFIDVEKEWRGSHGQMVYLLEQLSEKQCHIYIVCREGGALWKWAEKTGGFQLIDLSVSLSFIKNLDKLIKVENIQIIHAQSSKSHDIALALKFLSRNVKLIVSRRVDFHRRGGFYNKWKYSTHLIDLWIAVSNNIKNVLVEDGVDQNRIQVIYDGAGYGYLKNTVQKLPFKDRRNLTRESLNFQIREINKERRFKKAVVSMAFQGEAAIQHHETNPQFMVQENDFLFGIVAALVEYKDHENLLRAFSIAVNEQPNLKLLIVGDGKLWSKIDKLIDDLGLRSCVHMLGFRTDIPDLMKLFNGFVLSSYMDGLGVSLIDAMSAGLPIVCTDAGGFSEIIKNNLNGIMVSKKNPAAMAEALVRLSREKKTRQEMAKKNLEDSKKFGAEIMTSKIWQAYVDLIQNRL